MLENVRKAYRFICVANVSDISIAVFVVTEFIHKESYLKHCFTTCIDTPSQRVQFILGTEDDDEEHIPHDLFTEMDELCVRDGEECEWKETAR